MKVCGIDFDQTMFEILDAWGQAYTERTGNPFTEPNEYDFSDVMDEGQQAEMLASRTPAVYESSLVRPFDDAMWLADWLLDHGWTVAVLTMDTQPFVAVKVKLLERWFPRLSRNMVVAKDKWGAVPGMRFLVDDNPASCATVYPARPTNACVDQVRRLEDLRDLPEHLRLSDWKVTSFLQTIPWAKEKAPDDQDRFSGGSYFRRTAGDGGSSFRYP